jgi:type I restriction enzyme R subunit
MAERFSESTVEDAALAWLAELGWAVKHGPDMSPDGDTLTLSLSRWERESYNDVVLLERFRNALRAKLMSGEMRTVQRRMA